MAKLSVRQVRKDIWGMLVSKLRGECLVDEIDQDYVDMAWLEQQKIADRLQREHLEKD